MHFLAGGVLVAIIAIWVGVDASRRGMNGALWGIATFLLCIVFLPLYLIMRKPVPTVMVGTTPAGTARLCPACGKYHDGSANFCPFCGAPQPR